MNALVILSHPQEESFSHKIADSLTTRLRNLNYQVILHDLYKENFDPILKASEISSKFSFDLQVQKHMEELSSSDIIIIVHPDWWGQPPAMLKGWIDRILRPGVAYEFEGNEYSNKKLVQLLSDKKALVFITTDMNPDDDPGTLKSLWTRSVWNYCGICDVSVQIHYNTRETGELDRKKWIDDILLL
jgi:putative NADPH-quinone reductase